MIIRLLNNWLGNQDARLQYYKQKLNFYLINGPIENAAPCYHSMAYYYSIKGAYNQAISNYLEGAAIFRRYDPHYYCNAIGVVGQVYTQWGNVKKASQYLNYMLPIAKKIHDADVLCTDIMAWA